MALIVWVISGVFSMVSRFMIMCDEFIVGFFKTRDPRNGSTVFSP